VPFKGGKNFICVIAICSRTQRKRIDSKLRQHEPRLRNYIKITRPQEQLPRNIVVHPLVIFFGEALFCFSSRLPRSETRGRSLARWFLLAQRTKSECCTYNLRKNVRRQNASGVVGKKFRSRFMFCTANTRRGLHFYVIHANVYSTCWVQKGSNAASVN
jgi:hypothetical protein